jgi:hypothetical protein
MGVRDVILLGAAAAALAACGERMPSGDPAQALRTDLRGYEAPVGVMMGIDEKPYWVQAAVKGFREVKMGDMPGQLVQRDGVGGCYFTRPAAGARVALVHVDGSPMTAPVFAFFQSDVGHRAENLINVYKSEGEEVVSSDAGKDQLEVVDVIVTERSAPVHLVLATGGSSLLFNIHLAEGARVSRAAVIGAGVTGVANLDPSVPVEFLTGDAKNACAVSPMRTPADHWQFVRNARENPSSLGDILEKNYDYQRRWSAWHRASFGVASEPGAIGANSTAHVLVGPAPASADKRVTYRPLKGATLLVSRSDYLLAGSPTDYKKYNSGLVRAAALQAAGGDLASLRPAGS